MDGHDSIVNGTKEAIDRKGGKFALVNHNMHATVWDSGSQYIKDKRIRTVPPPPKYFMKDIKN